MPLANAVPMMVDKIQTFTNPLHPGYVGATEMMAPPQVASQWAGALKVFFGQMIAPALQPGALDAAEAAAVSAMTPLIAPAPGAAIAALTAGWMAFVIALPPLAAPSPANNVILPPPAPYVPPPLPPTLDPVSAPTAIASTTLAWATTGTFTLPPAPAILPWS